MPRANLILLVLNIVGAILYDWGTSLTWAIPQERGLNSVTAEPFIWAFVALPILAIFLLLNVSWGTFLVWRRDWSSGRFWLITPLIWDEGRRGQDEGDQDEGRRGQGTKGDEGDSLK